MAYKAALFDLDDTLLSSVNAKMLQHQVIAKRHYDVDITNETLRRAWGKPLTTMIDEMYEGAEQTERIMEILMETDQEFPKEVFEGSADAVGRLLDAGLHVGVVTSAPTKYARKDLARLGFPVDRLFCVLGEDAVQAHKPDPAVFSKPLEFLSAHGVVHSEVVYVGDHLVDYLAASSAGFDFIAVTTGIIEAHEFEAAGANIVTVGIVSAAQHILENSASTPQG